MGTVTKKFIIRDGFVVVLKLTKQDGSTYERRSESGEEITLDEDQYALHAHKLEFASQKDRDAALAYEAEAAKRKVADAAAVDPTIAALMAMMDRMGIPKPVAPGAAA